MLPEHRVSTRSSIALIAAVSGLGFGLFVGLPLHAGDDPCYIPWLCQDYAPVADCIDCAERNPYCGYVFTELGEGVDLIQQPSNQGGTFQSGIGDPFCFTRYVCRVNTDLPCAGPEFECQQDGIAAVLKNGYSAVILDSCNEP